MQFWARQRGCWLLALLIVLGACTPSEPQALPTLMTLPDAQTTLTPRIEIVIYITPTPLPPTPTETLLPSATETPTLTLTPSVTITPSITATPTLPPSATFTPSPSATLTNTATPIPWFEHNRASVREPTTLYAGPNVSYLSLHVLAQDAEVRILERNMIGTWLHVRTPAQDNAEVLDGWIMTGHLELDANLRFSLLPVNKTLADGDAAGYAGQNVEPLYAAPIISTISPEMVTIYQRGLGLGKRANAVTKIGDSVSANPIYLAPIRRNDHILGPYDYLQPTIDFFGKATVYESVAAQVGLSSFGVFDPINAEPDQCKPNESPLICEFRRTQPTIALIMFGPNDQWSIEVEEFDAQLRLLVEESLKQGVIPVLTTYSSDPQKRSWEASIEFNLAVLAIGEDYHVPVMNFWLASRDLPSYGLEHDGIHLRNYGFLYLKYDSGMEAEYGVSLQNLVALRMLDEIRRTVMQPAA